MSMIQDVDESLRALVKRDALNGSKADVAFDAPTKEWSSRRNTPTVDLYLYDIREDLEQREVMWESVRDDSGFVTERRPPVRRCWDARDSPMRNPTVKRKTRPCRQREAAKAGAPPQPRAPSRSGRPDPPGRRHRAASSPVSPSVNPALRPTRRNWFAPGK